MIGVTNATNGPSSTNLSSSMSYGTTTSYEINIEASNSPSTMKAISWLSCIAKWMNSVGYVGECFVVYKSVRMVFLETSLKQLGIEKLSARPEGAPVLRSNDNVGEVVRAILSDFEKSVAYELSTISEAGGTILNKGDLQEEGESFNVTFEKIHSTQARWVVQHFELREELLLSNVEKVIPAYASFLERFKKHIEGSKYPHMKYSVEDLHTLIIKDF
ncbi:hypothetical protein LguiA_033376 [Lonicera macranthoides]